MSETVWAAYGVVVVGAAATYVWRAFGVALAGKLDPNSPWFEWVGYVAYALLAGLVARVILLPVGQLAAAPLWVRLAGAGLAAAVFLGTRQRLLPAILAGMVCFVILMTTG